jgi:GNAT superfamily N-acetyltransferase
MSQVKYQLYEGVPEYLRKKLSKLTRSRDSVMKEWLKDYPESLRICVAYIQNRLVSWSAITYGIYPGKDAGVYVHRKYRKQGIATLLVTKLFCKERRRLIGLDKKHFRKFTSICKRYHIRTKEI